MEVVSTKMPVPVLNAMRLLAPGEVPPMVLPFAANGRDPSAISEKAAEFRTALDPMKLPLI